MRGNERRIRHTGRRMADRPHGLPTWARVLLLALALGLASYILALTRESTRPVREVAVLRQQALMTHAQLAAAQLDAALARARRPRR